MCVWHKMQIPRVIHRVKCQFFKSLHDPKSWFRSEFSRCRETGFFLLSSHSISKGRTRGPGTDNGHPPPAVCLALSTLSSMNGRKLSYYRTGSAKLIHFNWSFPWTLMGIGPSHRGQKRVQVWAKLNKLQNIFSQTSAKFLIPPLSEYVRYD